MIDNFVTGTAREIPAISTDDIDVRHTWLDFQLSDMNDRLHEIAEKVTSWKE